ncbi:MAG: hypothetical protein ABWY64_25740 [Tardiphaga sp.]
MTDIHANCRSNMEKADAALRAALDEIDRLETHSNSMIDALNADIDAKHAEIERLNTALKIAGENIVVFSEKCSAFTTAMLKAMALIDELVRENGRLCAASDQPPDVRLFAAKNSFDTAMKKLLGEQP